MNHDFYKIDKELSHGGYWKQNDCMIQKARVYLSKQKNLEVALCLEDIQQKIIDSQRTQI